MNISFSIYYLDRFCIFRSGLQIPQLLSQYAQLYIHDTDHSKSKLVHDTRVTSFKTKAKKSTESRSSSRDHRYTEEVVAILPKDGSKLEKDRDIIVQHVQSQPGEHQRVSLPIHHYPILLPYVEDMYKPDIPQCKCPLVKGTNKWQLFNATRRDAERDNEEEPGPEQQNRNKQEETTIQQGGGDENTGLNKFLGIWQLHRQDTFASRYLSLARDLLQ
ncbi:hypothetical protein BGZ76_004297 [Entomortierella beljakovae]|nr:hypothetical protein BGZ76_004297 [Entomortierella beljakovae]